MPRQSAATRDAAVLSAFFGLYKLVGIHRCHDMYFL
jgi:hypothetical protein